MYDARGIPSCSGAMASTLGKINPFRYRGYVYDEETGLYYLRSRYYNCNWLRFANADAVIGRGALRTHNVYTYCLCNPLVFSDLSGYEVTINIYNKDFSTIFDVDLGHVDVSIDGTIYSFGRYRKTWGPFGMLGEGILVVGNEKFMIEQQREKRDVARFTLNLTSEQEQLFSSYFDQLINSATKIETFDEGQPSERTWYCFQETHKYAEYNLLLTNCTTVTVDAFQYALGEDCPFHLLSVFVPSEMYNTLDGNFLKQHVKEKEVVKRK